MRLNKEIIMDFISNVENFDEVFEWINIVNSYDGSLNHLEYFYNDEEFFNIYFGINTLEAVRAVCFGDYKYADEYVRFNAYNNLESANMYEIAMHYDFFKDEIADRIIELAEVCDAYIDLPEEFYLN